MLVPGRVCNHFVLEGAVETSHKIPPKPCGLDCTVGVLWCSHGLDGGSHQAWFRWRKVVIPSEITTATCAMCQWPPGKSYARVP